MQINAAVVAVVTERCIPSWERRVRPVVTARNAILAKVSSETVVAAARATPPAMGSVDQVVEDVDAALVVPR